MAHAAVVLRQAEVQSVQYAATLARWFGVSDMELSAILPNLDNFCVAAGRPDDPGDLEFMAQPRLAAADRRLERHLRIRPLAPRSGVSDRADVPSSASPRTRPRSGPAT